MQDMFNRVGEHVGGTKLGEVGNINPLFVRPDLLLAPTASLAEKNGRPKTSKAVSP